MSGRTAYFTALRRRLVLFSLVAILASFVAFVPPSAACQYAKLAITKIETGVAAPGASYVFDVTGPSNFTVTVKAGETWTSGWLTGGTYHISERNAPAGAAISPNPVTLSRDGETVTVTATNPYPAAKLAIHKIETGSAAAGLTYTFDVTGPASFQASVAAGATWTSGWLPLGTYTVSERNAPAGSSISPNPVTLSRDGATVTVTATNPYPAGKLAIHKIETGSAAPGESYTFDVSGPVSFAATVAAGATWTSGWLPLGSYTVSERDAPDDATITPSPAVLTSDGATVTVTATNPYPAGKLAITKVETGSGAPGASHTFDVVGPVSFEATVAAGATWTSGWLPFGSYSISERDAPAGATISPNPVVLSEDGVTVTATATNPYAAGKLAIHKIEIGDTAPGATHTFDVSGPVSLEATVVAGATWTSDWLPLGTYTVSERNAPAGATISPNPVTLTDDGATVAVTAVNPYRNYQGSIAITKVETGTGLPGGTYTFDVVGPVSFSVSVAAGKTVTTSGLPLGSYTITERDAPDGATISPNPVVLSGDGQVIEVTATNPYTEVLGVQQVPAQTETLPRTGSGLGLAVIGGLLLVGGLVLVGVDRRRRHHSVS